MFLPLDFFTIKLQLPSEIFMGNKFYFVSISKYYENFTRKYCYCHIYIAADMT